MRRLSRTIVLLLVLLATTAAHAKPFVTLVTVGPGDEVWEKFGHNMLRLEDPQRGLDVCYNWGLFDFDQPGFIINFVQGRMLYTMAPLRTAPLLDDYRSQNRHVTFQRLNLTDTQLYDLLLRCSRNFRDAPDYRYDYFKDNCSTRVRDMIDASTGGALGTLMKGKPVMPPVTFRGQATRLMQGDVWVSLGADFALGPACDRPLDLWANGFLPEQVAQSAVPLAGPTTELWTSTRPPEAVAPPRRWPWLFLAGLGMAALIVLGSTWRPIAGRTLGGIWWIVSGLGGAFMAYVWLFTDHTAGYANQNLWHYSPLALAVLILQIARQRKLAAALAALVVAVSITGATLKGFGLLSQHNLGFILLALPINLAAARALTTVRPPDEVTPYAENPRGPGPFDPDGVRLHQPERGGGGLAEPVELQAPAAAAQAADAAAG